MRWSYKCGKLLGIDLYGHVTFFILLAYFLLSAFTRTGSMLVGLINVALVLITFAIVVMHELGHSMAARRFGIATRNIMLLPIGGVASLERMPEKPSEELTVALAGPAVNLVLALVFAGIRYLGYGVWFGEDFYGGSWPELLLQWLVTLNGGLLIFNLIPAFPMDGGRVLRALLSFKYDYLRATEIAVKVASFMAAAFVVYALFGGGGFMMVFIAWFVWRGGQAELEMIRQRQTLREMMAKYGTQGADIRQGIDLPNGERLVLIPSSMGWTLARVRAEAAEERRGSGVDIDTMYRNMASADRRQDREGDEEPRARIIDVE